MPSPLRGAPYTFRPLGLYDALDGEAAPKGACFSLQNLVHDITTPGAIWTGRPAAVALTNFSSFTQAGVVSVAFAVGTRIYGMIATARNAGYDEPFCFETATNAFITVTGTITSGTCPLTQPTSGAWTPPTMDVVGSRVFVTHPGFDGMTNFFGYFDISGASPAWNAGNTTTNSLPGKPVAVAQFNNRAYFACPGSSTTQAYLAYYTDTLSVTITNSTQFLTIGGSGAPITGMGGLPEQTTTGGILAALIIFKAGAYWQVTGDPANSNLVLNGPIGGVGTTMPRSITQTPVGLAFASSEGMRYINFYGVLSPAPMPGVRNPFQQAFVPSRVCAVYNNTVLRVAMQTVTNPISGTNGFVEYWYDFEINQWSGPHTWCSDVIVPMGDTFVVASNRAPAALYQSDTDLTTASTYTELGTSMPYTLQSSLLAQDENMSMKSVVETQINIDFSALGKSAQVSMISAAQGAVGTATITAATGTYWNQFNWNQANWSAAAYGLRTYNVDWSAPVVYKNASIAVQGTLTPSLRLGQIRNRTEELGYMNDQVPA